MKNILRKIIYVNFQNSFIGFFLIRQFRKKKFNNIKRKAEVIKDFQKKYNINVFIETGTYLGETIKEVKNNFNIIYSIELDSFLFNNAIKKFAHFKNINIIQGDSSRVLLKVLDLVQERAIFWLDAHTSGGITARGDKVTPITEELLAINNYPIKNHIILIDDAESFVGTNDYPKMNNLKAILKEINLEYKIEVKNNIIRIYI